MPPIIFYKYIHNIKNNDIELLSLFINMGKSSNKTVQKSQQITMIRQILSM